MRSLMRDDALDVGVAFLSPGLHGVRVHLEREREIASIDVHVGFDEGVGAGLFVLLEVADVALVARNADVPGMPPERFEYQRPKFSRDCIRASLRRHRKAILRASARTGRQMKRGSQRGLRRSDALRVRKAASSICLRRSNLRDRGGGV